jgi:flagellar biosynthetic protein FliR
MLTLVTITDTIFAIMWTSLRIGGMLMVAPILGAMFVPGRLRVLLTMVLATAMVPLAGPPPEIEPFSVAGYLAIAQEMVLGLAIGFVLKMAVEAAVLAGQLVSSGMGLSFAMVVDPQSGGMPLLGRFYLIVASLLLLAANAHLHLIAILAESFRIIPIGSGGIAAGEARAIADFAGLMFAGALRLSLPAVVAMLMVNVAFGVISRAAPTMNLFAVGFPVTLLMGLLIILAGIDAHGAIWDRQFAEAVAMINRLVTGG